MSKKILVTGSAGFIGSHVAEALIQKGAQLVLFDNLSTGKIENIHTLKKLGAFEFIQADIRHERDVYDALEGVDTVFHLAALGSVPRSVENPKETHDVNTHGTLNLLLQMKKRGTRRIVNSSSSSVYGNSDILPRHETILVQPQSPYAVSKMVQELHCSSFASCYGIEAVSLRYFNVFGPRQDPNSMYSAAIPRFLKNILLGEEISIYGDGKQTRDFTFVKNVVEANLLAANSKVTHGDVFNICGGKSVTILELIEVLSRITGKTPKLTFCDNRKGEVIRSVGDFSKANAILHWAPSDTLETGLQKTYQSWIS